MTSNSIEMNTKKTIDLLLGASKFVTFYSCFFFIFSTFLQVAKDGNKNKRKKTFTELLHAHKNRNKTKNNTSHTCFYILYPKYYFGNL